MQKAQTKSMLPLMVTGIHEENFMTTLVKDYP